MICPDPECAAEVPETAVYCGHCGTPLRASQGRALKISALGVLALFLLALVCTPIACKEVGGGMDGLGNVLFTFVFGGVLILSLGGLAVTLGIAALSKDPGFWKVYVPAAALVVLVLCYFILNPMGYITADWRYWKDLPMAKP